jgi:serine/threonine protein kinase
MAVPTNTTLHAGQIVGGKYCVDRLVGCGGMAEVWAGRNERTGKRIALKVILLSFASTRGAVELFRSEALAGSRVNHPNVVNVFDVIDHDGMICIVMELLEGESLGAYLRRKTYLGIDEAAAVLLPAMRGVAAANTEGVVHRDLKPQNIFICIGSDGRLITSKVLDFGISVMRENLVGSAQVAQLLATHGTPAYMSPEHISRAPDIDARADVYGFGVLFFEALTGRLPFVSDSIPTLLVRILNEPAPRITLFRPDLPSEVVDIVHCAMAKDPRERFASLNDFVRAVEECIMPSPALPRDLTHMVVVPVYAMSERRSGGLADPVVQVFHRHEAPRLPESNETRTLFTLSRDGKDHTGLGVNDPSPEHFAFGEVQTPATTRVRFARSARHSVFAAEIAAALFVAVVFVVIWIAFPKPAQYQTTDAPPLSLRPTQPALAPSKAGPTHLQAVTITAPSPAPAFPGREADDTPLVDTSREVPQTQPEPSLDKQPKAVPDRIGRSLASGSPSDKPAFPRSSATHPVGGGGRSTSSGVGTRTQAEPHTGLSTSASAPRAGALFPEDF